MHRLFSDWKHHALISKYFVTLLFALCYCCVKRLEDSCCLPPRWICHFTSNISKPKEVFEWLYLTIKPVHNMRNVCCHLSEKHYCISLLAIWCEIITLVMLQQWTRWNGIFCVRSVPCWNELSHLFKSPCEIF